MKHLLSLQDMTPEELVETLALAHEMKRLRGTAEHPKPLAGKSIAMIFSKSSTRTRVSFEVGVYELGGNPMFFNKDSLQLGRGEPIPDTAAVLSRYVHGIVIRYHSHEEVVELSESGTVPVVNALTDRFHPCQLLADLMTIEEHCGDLKGKKVAYIGDGASNMAYSWILAAKLAGIDLRIGAPKEYMPDLNSIDLPEGEGTISCIEDPMEACKDADVIYTDVWVSMGFEDEAQERLETLKPYQVNDVLLSSASEKVKVMHCLPAYRGKEITAEVLDGPKSIIWDEAENRLHAQKAILARLMES
ncbi:MAG: ornithine carbamoyltransferase [Lentisphaeria bacterium]|nr:ornithine carbamoyltransferase [Lentisphaeria bacterium]